MVKIEKTITSHGFQSTLIFVVCVLFFYFLLFAHFINGSQFVQLTSISLGAACIVYFREQIKKLVFNYREGSILLELEKFEEDVMTILFLQEKLTQISASRLGGSPDKLQEILSILGRSVETRAKKYASKTVDYANDIVKAYKEIDSIGSLRPADPDYENKKNRMQQSQKNLDSSFDNFLNYLKTEK